MYGGWPGKREVVRQIGFGIEAFDRRAGDGGEARIAFRIDVDAAASADRPLRRFSQRGLENIPCPVAFRGGRFTPGGSPGSGMVGHRVSFRLDVRETNKRRRFEAAAASTLQTVVRCFKVSRFFANNRASL